MNDVEQIIGDVTLRYVPTHEMFLLISIIIPAIFLLFSVGYTIFVIGEFKEKNKNIPKLLILTIAKVFLIGIIFYNMMNIILQNEFYQKASIIVYWLLMNYGIFVIIESLVVNMQLNKATYVDDKNNEIQEVNDNILKKKYQIINMKNNILFGFGIFIKVMILILSVITLFNGINIFSTLLTICFIFYIYMKIEFMKYIRQLK